MKFFIVGAGNVGMGIVYNLHLFLMKYGLSYKEAIDRFYIFDEFGLITTKRSNLSKR